VDCMLWIRFLRLTGATLILGATLGCRTAPAPAPKAAQTHDSNAATVVAEIALQKGDCRAAAENYAAAAANGDAKLAKRATEVALACENMPAAWQATGRWHALAPQDRTATIAYATVALKLYRIGDAQTALTPVVRGAGSHAETDLVSLIELLGDETDAPAALVALDHTVDAHNASPGVLAALGGLALQGYDFGRAERRAHEALERDAGSGNALRLLARVRVLQGDSQGAITAAREVMRVDPSGGTFELAEILTELDRTEEARQELERLRAGDTPAAEVDRRLALLAFQSGDLNEAEHRFADLVTRGEASDAALLYLGDIAARTGDKDAALSAYRQLSDSAMSLQARTRAAALLLERNDRTGAIEILDDYLNEHPDSDFEITLAKARLLADHGDAQGGLTLLSAALDRYPHHPAIEYERASMLERAGQVHDSVQAFERLLVDRPEDPTLLNALGYTLADHGLELPRAEGFIRRALVAMPDNPAILDSLGWVRVRRGDARGAVPSLERAYTIERDPEIAAHWGEALWLSGARAQARQVWAAALARHPDSEALKATLHRLLPPERS
jgi:predicted Zn-dependent protease